MQNPNRCYRNIILNKAKDIATSQGISKVNIRAVARDSGVSIGTIYNYFPSKADLLVAVIQNFWEEAFENVDWENFKDNDFYENLEYIYSILYHYLHKFKENWLEQLSVLKTQEKLLGRQKEDEYFRNMHSKIKLLIDMDENLQQFNWSQSISKENMSEFIFENMVIMLKKEEQDMKFFIEILKKVMSK